MTIVTNEELYNEMHRLKETIDRWRVKVDAKQEKHDKTLYGNGEPGFDERMRSVERMVDKFEKVADSVQPMIVFYKVGVWMATILGGSILILIWALITGQAELIFK